jgi:hypothetical protein
MHTYTASQAAQRFRVHRTTVLAWASRGWRDANGQQHQLEPVGTDPTTGAQLFRWDQLVTAEHETRSKRQRSHRRSRQLVTA